MADSTPVAADVPVTTDSIPLAAFYMVLASGFFVSLAALVKLASDEATAMQATVFRSVFSGLPVLAMMLHRRTAIMSPRRGLLFVRGAIGGIALYCYLWAVSHVPLADVMALQQMAPIGVAFLSVWLLKERPRPLYYVFAAVCLVGALLVVRPTRGLASLESSVALLSALFSAGAYVSVRSLTKTEPTPRIVLWFSAVALLQSLPFALGDWQPLSWRAILLLAGAGILAGAAQTLMTAGYRRAPAHIAAAFSYANVPLAYLIGLLFWHEQPDRWAGLGILLILVAGVVIVYAVRPVASDTSPH